MVGLAPLIQAASPKRSTTPAVEPFTPGGEAEGEEDVGEEGPQEREPEVDAQHGKRLAGRGVSHDVVLDEHIEFGVALDSCRGQILLGGPNTPG